MMALSSLARELPDLPRWVEARDILLLEEGRIFGLSRHPGLSFVLCDPDGECAFVVGRPDATAVVAVMHDGAVTEAIAAAESGDWLSGMLTGWKRSRIIVHTLPHYDRLPDTPAGSVGFLDLEAVPRLDVPPDLLDELRRGAEHSPIAAAFETGRPVSFCYGGAQTELFWDVAIDTLEAYQRRGYARLVAAHMIRYMRDRGKAPVWQALDDNPASWRLARALGFVEVDELVLFERAASDLD